MFDVLPWQSLLKGKGRKVSVAYRSQGGEGDMSAYLQLDFKSL